MSNSFAAALESRDIAAIRAWPKADLHNHGFLSGDRGFIAQRTGHDIAPVKTPLSSIQEMHDWVARNVGDLFSGAEGRLLGCEAAFALARKDGVTRIAFGDDVWMITQGVGSAPELFRSLVRLQEQVAPEIEWIPQLGISRHCRIAAIERWLAPFLELDCYKCIDLSGDEHAQPIEVFKPIYRAARAKGLHLKAHVGEFGTADDIWRAVETLELDEVQHGIAAASSPRVMNVLADNRIRLNVCPASNVLLGRVPSLARHPIRRLFDAGVVVTVNTDDALVFGRSVSEEFLALFEAGVFTAAELDLVRLAGLSDVAVTRSG
jgi:adenosine deaminase